MTASQRHIEEKEDVRPHQVEFRFLSYNILNQEQFLLKLFYFLKAGYMVFGRSWKM